MASKRYASVAPKPHEQKVNEEKKAMIYPPPTKLDKCLGPHQGKGGSLRGLSDADRIGLCKKGAKLA